MDSKVLDEAVEVALAAYVSSRGSYEGEVPASSDDIRAAILVALPVLMGEPVGYQWLDTGNFRKGMPPYGDERDWRPVYAPSLGEGDGR